ncbi:unnamed protein product, partial [Ixodes hexagonus]
ERCGVPPIQPALDAEDRILGGATAVPGSWPWQAQLRDHLGVYCGGTLISDQHVLTAAHCLKIYSLRGIYVSLGAHHRTRKEDGEQWLPIEEVCIHPQYDRTVKAFKVPDIAIVKLRQKVNMTSAIQPACLPKSGDELPAGETLYVTGWGGTDGLSRTLSSELKQAMVKAIPADVCREKWRFPGMSELICAGPEYGSACKGDSGGPVVRKEDGKWTVRGIVSTSPFICGTMFGPQTFVKVSAYTENFIGPYTDPNTSPDTVRELCRIVK